MVPVRTSGYVGSAAVHAARPTLSRTLVAAAITLSALVPAVATIAATTPAAAKTTKTPCPTGTQMSRATHLHLSGAAANRKSGLVAVGGCTYQNPHRSAQALEFQVTTNVTLAGFSQVQQEYSSSDAVKPYPGVGQSAYLVTQGSIRSMNVFENPDAVVVTTNSKRVTNHELEEAALVVVARLEKKP